MRWIQGTLGIALICLGLWQCTLLTPRPVSSLSEAAAALRAAKEVSADTLSADLFREASEYFYYSKREYKFKNFRIAKLYALKARNLAEKAEAEAMLKGANRTDTPVANPLGHGPIVGTPTPTPEPTPEPPPPPPAPAPAPIPADVYTERTGIAPTLPAGEAPPSEAPAAPAQ